MHFFSLGFMYIEFSANVWESRKIILEEELPLTKEDFWFSLTWMLPINKVSFSRLDITELDFSFSAFKV